ncbi:Formate hydrogenlyase subunit 4 [Clostridium liquoris]|jgi:NADH-quinone oxidoreductase subunit H|uniref:Formate hydrogenlyase subunit 4 n=1 Tax=Clostridium liquoris TaxID=1289519 RepID=A0A2T0B4J5_9CLOT|nr:complex I subunit 1 family protein [Clostridium liquoris]PRR78733.1 Formate hydrogenlyase subunit 4 [Clostridium liquoris]
METLKSLFYILIFPGLLFSICFGLILSGIDRKMVARMQRRIGPPIMQPFYDILKLAGKENLIPRVAAKKTFILAPLIGLISVITISLFIPFYGIYFFSGQFGDIIVILYLLTIPAVALIIGGAASGSPYASIGISREMVTMLSYEVPLVIIVLAVGAKAGIAISGNVTFSLKVIEDYQKLYGVNLANLATLPAALAFLFVIPAEVGTVPFDVAEAETEICEGPLVEYSGFYLGIYKLTQAVKMFIMGNLFVSLFLGGINFGNTILNVLFNILLIILVIVVSVSFVRSVVGRIRIEQTLKFFWTIPTVLAVISLILAYI